MLRQGNTDFPTKRVFIDKNGFRHFWTGFLTPSESLRKTDGLKDYTGIKKPILRDGGDEETKTEDDATTVTVEETTTEKAEDDSEKKDPDPEIIEEALTAADEITTAIADIVTTPTADLTTTGYPVFRAEEIATAAPLPENTVAPYDPGTTVYPHNSLSVTKRIRTVAKTTFFCPYLGTIRREARRDNSAGHPHDVNLNYERLFPARRKYVDSPVVHIDPDLDFFKK
ncbi:unnamed protein product [Chrysodeixis includens]|uniref:Uncharacterized protein n=1 Tax=Chrysodeixis includens TaxID=689277 RepID=A0A9N8Q045_CHRIL|nr:unnamed protein product [Chrysodeixis includens]